MNEFTVFWIVALIVSIVIELVSLGLTSIWFAGGALTAALAAALNLPLWLQILLFVVVTLALLVFTRPIAVKYFNKERVRTNVESLIGRQAIVISEIDNIQGIGQVTVGGQEWSARSYEEEKRIPVGSVVRVMTVSGVKLIVMEETVKKAVSESGEAPENQ
ncbi:MAG: NfeD family protein [Bacteroidales bacterium]|nr:NfeD family protein [Lachnoclostridium sp.]MCM1383403.1 NfeD family protein [Lachnoclostridium sp.]MCM1464251.1 NfeD family protein [Bacteroidales bacterium]